jgi:hypothetical protein
LSSQEGFVVTTAIKETFDSRSRGGHRYEELTRRLDLEIDRNFPWQGDSQAYRDAIAQVAMLVLVDFVEHPEHRALPRGKDDLGSRTLYRTVAAGGSGIAGMHITGLIWQTSTAAADAVLTQLAVGCQRTRTTVEGPRHHLGDSRFGGSGCTPMAHVQPATARYASGA